MARVAHEGPGIGDHADEAREQAEVGEGVELPFHAFLLVEEPPPGAVLDLAGDGAILKVTDHGGEDVVIRRIEIVEDGLGQAIVGIEAVQVGGQGLGLREIADGIEAGVGSELGEETAVVIAQRTEVELFDPAALGVEVAEEHHQVGGELGVFAG